MFKRGFSFAPGYRLEQFLGRGQFGQVWQATAPGGTSAAVKFIDLSGGEGAKEYEGVKQVKQIRHANLMPIIAIWLLDQHGQPIEEEVQPGLETVDISALASAMAEKQSPGDPGATTDLLSAKTPPTRPWNPGAVTGFADSTAKAAPPPVDAAWLAVGMLLGGQSLQHRLRECVQSGLAGIPPRELLGYIEESAKGLDFLNQKRHDLGEGLVAIQHCDVKPANIVLIGSSAVVCDFGLARILSRNQITATSASGTPAYMAPEAISGRPSRNSDQYSLAVTYYHLRTGSLPISDGTLWQVLEAHRTGKLDFSLVPEHEQAVLRRATMLQWEERFESNQDMVDSLREALRAEGETRAVALPTLGASTTSSPGDAAHDPTLTLMPGQRGSAVPTHGAGDFDPTHAPAAGELGAEETKNDRQWEQTQVPLAGAALVNDAQPASPQHPWAKQLKWGVASVAAAGLLWLVLHFASPGPNDTVAVGSHLGAVDATETDDRDSTQRLTDGDGASERDAIRELTADEHFAAARSALSSDYELAVEHFRRAAAVDPGVLQPRPQLLLGHKGAVNQLHTSIDGNRMISVADDASEFVWMLDRGTMAEPITRPTSQGQLIDAVAISTTTPQRYATGGTAGEIVVGDLVDPTQQPRTWNVQGDEIVSLTWHPQARYLVAGTLAQSILLIDTGSPAEQDSAQSLWKFEVSQGINCVAVDSTGQWLLLLDDRGAVWRFTWEEIESITRVPAAPTGKKFTSNGTNVRVMLAVATQASSGGAVVTGGDDGELTAWKLGIQVDLLDREVPHSQQVEALAATPLGLAGPIASGGGDGVIGVLRGDQGAATPARQSLIKLVGHQQLISSLDLSRDGRWLIAGSHDGAITLWDLDRRQPTANRDGANPPAMLRLRVEAAGNVHAVRFDPAGRWVAAGYDDGVIALWDLQHAQLLIAVEPSPTAPPEPTVAPPDAPAAPDAPRTQTT